MILYLDQLSFRHVISGFYVIIVITFFFYDSNCFIYSLKYMSNLSLEREYY